MAEYNQVDLQIGTETQLANKVKDLPVGTLVGLTDPIHKTELDTTLQNEITSAGGKVVDLGTATSGTLTADQLQILQASDNNVIMRSSRIFRMTDKNLAEDSIIYIAVNRRDSTITNEIISIEPSMKFWQYIDPVIYCTPRPTSLPLETSLVMVHPSGGPEYLETSEIAQINERNTFTKEQSIAYDITSDHCITLTMGYGVRVGNNAGSPLRTEYDNGEIRRRTSATDLYTYTLPTQSGTFALTSDIEKIYEHNIEFSTDKGVFHYSFYSNKSDAYTSADLPETEQFTTIYYEVGLTPDGHVNNAVMCGSISRSGTTETLHLECSGVYYDASTAEFKYFNADAEGGLEINPDTITDTVKQI